MSLPDPAPPPPLGAAIARAEALLAPDADADLAALLAALIDLRVALWHAADELAAPLDLGPIRAAVAVAAKNLKVHV